MWKMITILCLMAGGLLLVGCVDVKADASGWGKPSEPRRTTAQPSEPGSDPRTTSDLRRENAQLRVRMAELEKEREDWLATLDRQKQQIRDLERRRDDLKDERDRYKKALGEDEDDD